MRVDQLIETSDKILKTQEDKTVKSLEASLDRAFGVLEKQLATLYGKALEDINSTSAFRLQKMVKELGEVLNLINPSNQAFYEERLQNLIIIGQERGITLSTEILNLFEPDKYASLSIRPDVEAAAFAAQNAGARLKNHSEDFRQKAISVIGYNLAIGSGARKMAGELRRDFGLVKYRAEAIARTETLAALNEAADRVYAEAGVEYVQFFATADERTCKYCGYRNQRIYKRTDVIVPLHVSCFPGDTIVSGLKPNSATSRYYSGEVVVIKTASGKNLTSTPNHPILTPKGWVAMGELVKGNNVISTRSTEGCSNLVNPDDYHIPTEISQVFTLLNKVPEMVSTCVPITSEDFHGDVTGQSDVNIVFSDRFLRNRDKSITTQPFINNQFGGRISPSPKLLSLSIFTTLFPANCTSRTFFMGGLDLFSSLFKSHFRPFQFFGFPLTTGGDTHSFKTIIDTGSRDSHNFRDSVNRFPSLIQSQSCRCIKDRAISASNLDFPFTQPTTKSSLIDSDLSTELLERFSGLVLHDEIIFIERRHFSGHIYNLETSEHWYTANNIIVHNCRCNLTPVKAKWIEKGLVDFEWATKYHNEAGKEITDKDSGVAPFEKAGGRKTPPKSYWNPGETPPRLIENSK